MTETLHKDNMISSDISNCRLNSSPKHAVLSQVKSVWQYAVQPLSNYR